MGVHRGKAAVARIMASWVGTWHEYRLDVEELIDAGDHIVLGVRESGRGKASGVPMESRYAMVWTFRDARIIRGLTYESVSQALDALSHHLQADS
jgi:ketosteroid isomerase-like protein